MAQGPFRVLKLGGSLLDLPDLAARVDRWRRRQSPAVDALVAGGGPLADVLRRADERHGLGEEAAHWLCVQVLGVSAAWVARLFPVARLIDRLDALRGLTPPALVVVDPSWHLRQQLAGPRPALPRTWAATSDSIAALVAETLGAAELVLFKSRLPTTGCDLTAWAAEGLVDPQFPLAAARLPRVCVVDLRAADLPEACCQ